MTHAWGGVLAAGSGSAVAIPHGILGLVTNWEDCAGNSSVVRPWYLIPLFFLFEHRLWRAQTVCSPWAVCGLTMPHGTSKFQLGNWV